eukprot:201150-Rhodomonas_salina.1
MRGKKERGGEEEGREGAGTSEAEVGGGLAPPLKRARVRARLLRPAHRQYRAHPGSTPRAPSLPRPRNGTAGAGTK